MKSLSSRRLRTNIEPSFTRFSLSTRESFLPCLESIFFRYGRKIGIIRSILVDLSKEDYNQNLYAKFQFDEDWLYVETFHYRRLRVMLVSADGEIERYSKDMRSSKVVPNSTPSVRFSFVLNKAAKMSILDKVKPSDIIEKDTFEDLWGEDASNAK